MSFLLIFTVNCIAGNLISKSRLKEFKNSYYYMNAINKIICTFALFID